MARGDPSSGVRVLPHENPLCQRVSCDHPLKGGRREGHFDMGMGPCKSPGCACVSFQYTDPAFVTDMRRFPMSARSPGALRAIDLPPPTYAPVASQYQAPPEGIADENRAAP
jgi:hypothetical protein